MLLRAVSYTHLDVYKRQIDCVYFEAIPHTSLDARNKVIELSKKLAKYTSEVHLHIVNFTSMQEEIYKNCHPSYCITIMPVFYTHLDVYKRQILLLDLI